ncbi:MAG: zinc-dependent metalloprotease [Proteobacteria bacterium]|nr:zinc-dependent metalloprotease [Pseudomonadota bacterium]
MKTYTLLFLVLTTIVSSVSAQTLFQFRHLALQKVEKEELSTLIRSYQAVSLNPKTVASICAKGNCSFTLKTPDRVWNITLEENNLLSPGYQMAVNGKSITEKGSTVKTYKGYIGANPDNYVRLTIGDNFLDGYLKIDSTLLFIKPIKHILPNYKGINQFLLFNSTDIINNPSVSDCGVLSSTKKLGDQINAQNTNTLQSNSNACHFLEIATEADFEFYQFRGSNVTTANNSILSELNQVEGLYESTFNMSFVVSFQNVWTTSNDPYSTTSSMADILSELITKWQNDFSESSTKKDIFYGFTDTVTVDFMHKTT